METSVISQHGFVNSLSKAKLQIGIFSIQKHDAGAFVAQDQSPKELTQCFFPYSEWKVSARLR